MKILIRLSDNLCVAADDSLQFTATDCRTDNWINQFFTPDQYAIQDAMLPIPYVDGAYSYSKGIWTVVNTAAVAAAQSAINKQTLAALANAVQTVLDSTANAYGFDTCERAITYWNDPNPAYAAEGQAFLAWRSAVWTYCQTVETNVLAGKQAVPTSDQLIAGLPSLKLPPPNLPVV